LVSIGVEESGCPLGFKCKKAHSTYERLYHPLRYKTNPCDVYETKPSASQETPEKM